MSIRPDITVYDDEGNLALVVEIKNKTGTDKEWAAKTRRNMFVHGFLPRAGFFLMTLPDRFYLWKGDPSPELEKPAYEVEPGPFFQSYFDEGDMRLDNLSEGGFELLVVAWLSELIRTGELPDVEPQYTQWLVESGLFKAIQRGHVVAEVAA